MTVTRRLAALLLLGTALLVSADAQAQNRTLTLAITTNVNTWDPHKTATVPSDMSVLSHIYPTLVYRAANLELRPALAQSWTAVDDNTWQFKLVPNAAFSNGEKLDAAAVKWNFDRVLDPKNNARIATWFALVKEVVVIDPTTIHVKTSAPFGSLPAQMTLFMMLPPKWASETDPAKGTMSGGAYVMTENVPGSSFTLEPNQKYWGPKPEFDKVVFRIIPEPAGRVAALSAGEVDYINQVPVVEIKRLEKEGKFVAGTTSSLRNALIKFNTRKPPFDNKLVRQAVNYAVDKKGIVDALFDGRADVAACQVVPKEYFGFSKSLSAYPYDPEKAKQLLKQSGIDLKQPVELEVPVSVYIQAEEATQAIASQLQAVGMNIKIIESAFGPFMDKYLKTRTMASMAYLTFAWPTLDADGVLGLFYPGSLYDYWDSKEFGVIVDQARATLDRSKSGEIYSQAAKYMCDEAPAIFLYNQPKSYAVSKRVEWSVSPDDWIRAADFKLKN